MEFEQIEDKINVFKPPNPLKLIKNPHFKFSSTERYLPIFIRNNISGARRKIVPACFPRNLKNVDLMNYGDVTKKFILIQ